MKLTKRGKLVLTLVAGLCAFALGFLTGPWANLGEGYVYYGDSQAYLDLMWEIDTASDQPPCWED